MISSSFQPPLIPGMGSHGAPAASGQLAQTKNPFFNQANQFLPRNLNDIIRWVRFITVQSPVSTEVLRKLSTYPITEFTFESRDPSVKAKYSEIVSSFKLKSALHDIGFQYHTVGNVFLSIYFPIHRSYVCPSCGASHSAKNADFLTFHNYEMKGTCPKCGSAGIFIRKDTKSLNVQDMNLITWDPLQMSVNHNPITGKSHYYYTIPADIRKKIQMGDKLTLEAIPWEFVIAVKDGKDFMFEDGHIFHMRNLSVGMSVSGVAVPPLVSHFSLVFYQATLRRANESIATDYMTPLRVVFPQAQSGNSDPVISISMRNFVSRMEEAFIKHKRDNNHVLVAPVPVGYQAISGEGKALLVNQEIAQAEESLLLSLGVSRELLSGSTNWTSSTVGLRMLKNTLDSYVGQALEVIEWIFRKTSNYLGLPYSKVGLTPFQLTDDDALKSVLVNLMQGNAVSMTTIYEAMGRSYEEELERIAQDAKMKARHDVRLQFEIEQAQYMEGMEINKGNEKDNAYMETLKQCQDMAAQLSAVDPNSQREVLNQLRIQDYAKYLLVARLLLEIQSGIIGPADPITGGPAMAPGGSSPMSEEGQAGEAGPGGGQPGASDEELSEEGSSGSNSSNSSSSPKDSSEQPPKKSKPAAKKASKSKE